ncbi:alpha/beta hydrolase [Bacterioplanoides sp. SCSIO 12839]|uniref:alpha/beta hydrolase n=1 Tax=Bacterioplanoides sp. SCSIO 12839 TaxID=2829569 RepID=UPI002103E8A2|nr:CocE/NonD family hydrolase [Bacterioplanoides sp. SCSIO 12839]UTW47946.1 alpha/beta hydrolase [Bacterioplanoides sp. SCSIO 12839]
MKTLTLKTSVGELAANLYLPEGEQKNLPLAIITGAWTTVKEQMPTTYAQALSERGFAVLVFDFRGWGESADDVKYLEDPARKTADIAAVIDMVTGQQASEFSDIDTSRIYGLGVCASAGYMLDAVNQNAKVKAAAVVAPWLHDRELANAIYGGEDNVNGLIKAGEEAAAADDAVLIEAASTTNENSLMFQAPYYTEAGRGLIPEYDNQFNVASWKPWLTYNALAHAGKQDKPVLMVASEAMALPAGTKQYLQTAGENVKAEWLADVTQFDFYDVAEHVSKAADLVAQHFNAN